MSSDVETRRDAESFLYVRHGEGLLDRRIDARHEIAYTDFIFSYHAPGVSHDVVDTRREVTRAYIATHVRVRRVHALASERRVRASISNKRQSRRDFRL